LAVNREFLTFEAFKDLNDVYKRYEVYLKFYSYIRTHGSLNYMTPEEFCNKYIDKYG